MTALRAHFQVAENAAVIDPLQGNVDSIPLDLRGRLSTSLAGFGLTIFPGKSEIELLSQPPAGAGFFGVRVLGEGRREGRPLLREALVRGTLWPAAISLTITEQAGPDTSSVLQTTYLSEAAGPAAGSFLLPVVPPASAEGVGLSDERKETR